MIRALIGAVLLAGCSPSPSPSVQPTPVATASQTPYEYPDLPGDIEGTIAEGDCDELDVVADFMDRDSVDPIVRAQAMEAILHRARELGC